MSAASYRGFRDKNNHNEIGVIDWFATLLKAEKLQRKDSNVKFVRAQPRQSELAAVLSHHHGQKQHKISLKKIVRRPRYALMSHLNVILLDTSASTLTALAIQKSKAIVDALNRWTYLRRETLSLVSFGNDQINMLIPPSRPRRSLLAELNDIPAGGGTPFRAAVLYINNYLLHRQRRRPHESQSLFILTDGRGRGDVSDIHLAAKITLIDMECGKVRLQRCYQIAQQWDAEYLHVDMIPVG